MKNSLKEYLLEILPKNIVSQVNRSFEVVGDIAIIEVSQDIEKYDKEIGAALLKTNRSLKTVLKKSGTHHGEFRTQDLVYVAGEEKYDTIYLENGIRLMINPGTVYFSARLSTERGELMDNIKPGKRVLVMFSGAGPYTFVAMKKQPDIARITSIEINPEGHKYALESLKLNKNLIKKSTTYNNLVQFMKENNIPVIDKKIIELLNNLKYEFINGDVRKEVDKLTIKNYNEDINNYHNELFKQNPKDLFEFLKELNSENIYLDLDIEIDKNKIKNLFIMFSQKFDFVFKINDEKYLFDTNLTKSFLLNYLENDFDIKTVNLYDEIFMPLPKDAELFLDCAFKTASKNAIVHMYDFVHENEFPMKSEDAVIEAAKKCGREIEIISTRKVGQYSPRKFRVCCDFRIL